ncbi:hypothetical protein PoB_005123000 [Plakobranchus ocellatus]|uniref:Uncharacterized protein n=1 Tax=Plakobranchus ocellatus TaxID=259542 RepID=A0AAV4BZE8_9GAST|nr:hypothetical protein PoB_005123000 [Plakobranchus ocellatus]
MDLYEKYIQLADNFGIDMDSRLEWAQFRMDREIEQQEQKMKLGCDEAQMILQEESESSFNKYGTLSIESAKVFCRSCTLLRDSGCNTAAVKEDLELLPFVAKTDFQPQLLTLIVDYFSGPIEVCVLKDSVANVILGNIKGVRSLTVAPMVNDATRAQSKRATMEVPAGPQEVLPKSLVDSSLTLL